MISRLFKYYYYKLRRPEFIDFVDHGLGIESRSIKFRSQWKAHLAASRNFQITALNNSLTSCSKKDLKLCVLGAGRLLDFPSDQFTEAFSAITLVDADPSCVSEWKRLKASKSISVDWQILDVTSRLENWSHQLQQYFSQNSKRISKVDLEQFLSGLAAQTVARPWKPAPSDFIVSLNILSQLGVYCRDRVVALIKRLRPDLLMPDGNLPPEIEMGLRRMVSILELEHLKVLCESKAKKIILIYDDEFYYYSAKQAQWQVEKALSSDSEVEIPQYSIETAKTWLWHLVPLGSENAEYGEIHRVQALSLIRD